MARFQYGYTDSTHWYDLGCGAMPSVDAECSAYPSYENPFTDYVTNQRGNALLLKDQPVSNESSRRNSIKLQNLF